MAKIKVTFESEEEKDKFFEYLKRTACPSELCVSNEYCTVQSSEPDGDCIKCWKNAITWEVKDEQNNED